MKSYVISITEVDDVEFALEELETEMAKIKLSEHSVGIVSADMEFIKSGVYDAVVNAVPFPLVGMSTYMQNANGMVETYLFSILILSADDCSFSFSSEAVLPDSDIKEATKACYERASGKEKPKMALLYAPFLTYQLSPHNYLSAIAEIDGSIPVFGSLAGTEASKYLTEGARTLCDGAAYADRIVILLISGNISPKFYVESIENEVPLISRIGKVTAADGNFVTEINNTKVNDVIGSIGYNEATDENSGVVTTLFAINQEDENGNLVPKAVRPLYMLQDGIGIFGGSVPVGCVLSVIVATKEIMVSTAKALLQRIKDETHNGTVLIYSCGGRYVSLLDEPLKELELAKETFKDCGFTYVMAYSGGEICPVSVTETNAHNREHNSSLIAWTF